MGDREAKARQCQKIGGIYFVDPDVEEFKDIMKNARRKLEILMPAAMPCKLQREKYRETVAQLKNTRHNTLVLLKPMNL